MCVCCISVWRSDCMIFMNLMWPLFLGYIVFVHDKFDFGSPIDYMLSCSPSQPPQSPYEVQFSLMEIGLLSCNATQPL
jgi:hypothetical protein